MPNSSIDRLVKRTAARKAGGLIPDYSRSSAGPKSPRVSLPCVHLGQPTGETRPCQGCGGRPQQVPLVACAVYGVAAVGKAVKLADGTPVRPCSTLCPSYSAGTQTNLVSPN